METTAANHMSSSLSLPQHPFPLWQKSTNMGINSERTGAPLRPHLSSYKKRLQPAFRTVSVKRRPIMSMVTSEHLDPSILARGQVVGFASSTAKESKPAGYSFHNSFHNAYSEQQPGNAQSGRTLKQPSLQFSSGISNRIVKAAHPEAKKTNGWVLNPNSPTFVSRLTPVHTFTAIPETHTHAPLTVPDNANNELKTSNGVEVIYKSPVKSTKCWDESPYWKTKEMDDATDENGNALKGSAQVVSINYGRSPVYEKLGAASVELESMKDSARLRTSYGMDVSQEETESQRFNGYLKHPLHDVWSFWYFRNERNKNWIDNQVQIGAINSVENFWATYNSLEPASSLRFGCDYAFFRKGISPMWEDKGNCKGGRWIFTLDKHKRSELDSLWEELLFALIGNKFLEHQGEICGAVINLREKGDKLAIWTANADNEDVQKAIGRMFKAKLKVPTDILIRYEVHSDNNTRRSTPPKARYQI